MLSVPLDIYKKTPIVTVSAEHVLLNALGGRLVSSNLLDKSTNDTFGSTIDVALADCLRFIRVFLDAKSGDGGSPPTFRGATTAEGEIFNVLPGGKPEIAAPRITIAKTEKVISVSGRTRSLDEARRLLARKASQYRIAFSEIEAGARAEEEHVPMLHFDLDFGPVEFRAVLKMACNLLAHSRASVFLAGGFDGVRNLVLTGGGDHRDFLEINTAPVDLCVLGTQLGPLDHLLIVRGDAGTGAVEAFVSLFGHLQFVIRLGLTQLEASFVSSYRVDQLSSRDRFDAGEDMAIETPTFRGRSEIDHASALRAFGDATRKIMPVIVGKQRESAIDAMVEKSMMEAFGSIGDQPATDEQHKDFVSRLTERIVKLLEHEGMFDADE